MKRIAEHQLLVAQIASAGAEQLMMDVIEEVTAISPFTPPVRQYLDDLYDCAHATANVVRTWEAWSMPDGAIQDISIKTLARMNVRNWQLTSGALFPDQYLLSEVLGRLLATGISEPARALAAREGAIVAQSAPSDFQSLVNRAVAAACVLAGDATTAAMHMLVAVSLDQLSAVT
jgi:hypothetical protein